MEKVYLVLDNGDGFELSLTFGDLLKLRGSNKELYKRYRELENGLAKSSKKGDGVDFLDLLEFLHIGYICAGNDHVSFEDFANMVPQDREYLSDLFIRLYEPKKAQDSAKRSS